MCPCGPSQTSMEVPGGSGVWLAPSPSPSGPAVPDRHDEHGAGTFIWPPAGTSTWPLARTFSWPRTEDSTDLVFMSRPDLEEERYLGLDAEFADLPLQRLWCRHVQRLPLRNSAPDVRPVRRLMRRHHSPASRPYETDPRDARKYSSRRAHRAISAVGCKSPKRRAPTSRYGRQRGFGRETPLPVGDSGIGCAQAVQ